MLSNTSMATECRVSAADRQSQALRDDLEVGDVEPGDLAPAQRRGVAEQQEGAIVLATQALIASGGHGLHHSALLGAVTAAHAAQKVVDHRVGGVEPQPGLPVRGGHDGEAAAEGGGRQPLG